MNPSRKCAETSHQVETLDMHDGPHVVLDLMAVEDMTMTTLMMISMLVGGKKINDTTIEEVKLTSR